MSDQARYNQPYNSDLEPALQADATVEVMPSGETYAVDLVETFPAIRTQEFVVPANDTLEEQEIRSLYVQTNVLGQYRLFDIPSDIEIEVSQGGEESPRYNNKNERGFLDSDVVGFGDNAQQTELWQWENTDLFFDLTDTSGSQQTFTLKYTGWGYAVEPIDIPPEEADIQVLTERESLKGRR